jgi:hypothetical protein
MITTREILSRLSEGKISLPPLSVQLVAREERTAARVDANIRVRWMGEQAAFAVEVKALSTPKIIREAMNQAQAAAKYLKSLPMIIVPYLNEEALWELEGESISGIDLCGNGIVIVPNRLYVFRTGNPNQFRNTATIKNIYRRNSAIVSRVFLIQPEFQRVTDVWDAVNCHNLFGNWDGQPMTLPTVSKVLKGLEEDLIVGRDGSSIRLLQAEKLLGKLVESYTMPRIKDVVNWKLPNSPGEQSIDDLLRRAFSGSIPAVVTGTRSASQYAVMQTGETLSIYCPAPMEWLAQLPGTRTDRFPTISLVQTEEASVYFDPRANDGLCWASPVQSYLELIKGDKRDQETALQVKELILSGVAEGKI